MGKILLIVAIVITALTAALSYFNRGKWMELTEHLQSAQFSLEQTKTKLSQADKELKSAKETLSTATVGKEEVNNQLQGIKSELEKAKTEAMTLAADISMKDEQILALTSEIQTKNAEAATPVRRSGVVETVPSEYNIQIAEKDALVTKLQADLANARSQLEDLRYKEQDRRARKVQSGLEGRILAVNQAWNFVVINLGDRNGISNNAEMMIIRGDQFIGRVRVTSVEPSTAIADIVANSLVRGAIIQPGDRVVFPAFRD